MLRKNVPKMTPTSKMKYTEKCPNLNMPSKSNNENKTIAINVTKSLNTHL